VTELEQLVAYIGNTIDCLLRISLVIQKPAPHDRFIKSGRFDQSFRQPWDVRHVREKFPNIPDWLSERLGKANSRRRQFLEYRQAHHERIARIEVADAPGDTGTVVSSLPTLLRQHQELWTSATPEISEADTRSDTGVSETSYAETIADGHALFVATMPEAARGGAVFECPYCFMLVRGIFNRLQWKYVYYSLLSVDNASKLLTSMSGDTSSPISSLTYVSTKIACLQTRHFPVGISGFNTINIST
jgi:hypothetical protein